MLGASHAPLISQINHTSYTRSAPPRKRERKREGWRREEKKKKHK